MNGKHSYVALLVTAALSLTLVPSAAALMPKAVSEYMARLAAGQLYIPYYEAVSSAEETQSTESAVSSAVPEESAPMTDGTAVQAMNLSRLTENDEPTLLLMNETDYSVYLKSAASTALTVGSGAVLIMHTHGTEAYLPDGATHYAADEDFRSNNAAETVVAVGDVFAAALESAGIEVYHDRTMYDADNFENAYTLARSAIKKHLAEKPQIRYIIDLHRDAVTDGDGNACKTLCTVNGEDCAQVMLVVGTNAAGAAHPDWRNNLCVAAKYQSLLTEYRTLARPVYLRNASYNQQLCTGAMLLEVGSAANTISEAKKAAAYAAEAFVKLYKDLS